MPNHDNDTIRIRGALVDELRSMDWASRGARTKVRRLVAVTDALTAVVSEGTGTRASALGRPVAGKTGTNDIDGDITSAWFVGYTKQISTAVMFVAGDGGTEDLEDYKRPQDSTFFGSTRTNFSSAGCFLYNKEVMMAFSPTDLP